VSTSEQAAEELVDGTGRSEVGFLYLIAERVDEFLHLCPCRIGNNTAECGVWVHIIRFIMVCCWFITRSCGSVMSGMKHDGVVPDVSGVDPIARQLTGELMCIGCGYNLRGLSIREVCPECGMSIRATLLGIVDPKAEELEDLASPWIVGNGVVLWSVGALIACISVWMLRINEIVQAKMNVNLGMGNWVSFAGLLALCFSGVGAMTLIRPHQRWGVSGRLLSIRAAIGVSAYIPLVLLYWVIYRDVDFSAPMPLIQPGVNHFERSLYRLGLFACVLVIVIGIRPNALKLAMRSVIVRTGRVDRQSMYALLASFAVAAVGDAFNIVGTLCDGGAGMSRLISDLLMQLHVVLVAVGSVLITLGMINIVIDTVRLRPVLLHRGVGLSDVFETNLQKDSRRVDS